MTATETFTPKRNRETWQDWMLPGQTVRKLYTREELSASCSALGFKVTPNDFRYWEGEGVIPRSIKKWHEGATRAVYPDWMRNLLLVLRTMQDEGDSLESITEFLRDRYRNNTDSLSGAAFFEQVHALRDVHQIPANQKFMIPDIVADHFTKFFSTPRSSDIAYLDIKIVNKDGAVTDFARYVVGDDNGISPDSYMP